MAGFSMLVFGAVASNDLAPKHVAPVQKTSEKHPDIGLCRIHSLAIMTAPMLDQMTNCIR